MVKTILITGATGLIGREVSWKCQSGGMNVIGISSKDCDIRQNININEPIDYVVHLASPTKSSFFVEHPVETIDIIFNGTKNILELARDKKVESIVIASSIEAYGKNITDNFLDEKSYSTLDINDIRSSYALGKVGAEFLSKSYFAEYNMPVKVARLATVIPNAISDNDNRLIPFAIRSAKRDGRITLDTGGEKKGTYISLQDAASALLYILTSGVDGEVYNISHPNGYYSVKQIVELIASNVGSKIEFGGSEQSKYPSSSNWNMSPNKLMKLGWRPEVTIPEALERLSMKERENGKG